MTHDSIHPAPERLDEYVSGELADPYRSALVAHLAGCAACRAEVEELRAVHALLAELPRFEPAPDFADRTLARYRGQRSWVVRATEWVRSTSPRSRFGLGLAAAFMALPTALALAGLYWLISHPAVTWQGVAAYGRELASQATSAIYGALVSVVLSSDVALRIFAALQGLMAWGGPRQIATAAVLLGIMSAAAFWILVANLFEPRNRVSRYAQFRT